MAESIPEFCEPAFSIPLGVVVAREAIDHPWQSHAWRPLSVFLAAPDVAVWRLLQRGPGFEHYHAATLPLELHRKETAGYTVNLANGVPCVYVVLREMAASDGPPVVVHLVTASPFDVQAHGASADEIVGRVAMPDDLVELVAAFVEAYHVDEAFHLRQAHLAADEPAGVPLFGRDPIPLLADRMRRAGREPGQR